MRSPDTVYALMAGNVYRSTRDPMNRFPAPQGWSEFNYQNTQSSGFEAISFKNLSDPNEIVISFSGTGPGMNEDWWADFGLT